MDEVILKVRRKGVLIIPKWVRERLGVEEGDELSAEVSGGGVTLKPFKPRVVDVDPKLVEELLAEEGGLEREAFKRVVEEARRRR